MYKVPIYITLLFLVFTASCNFQDKTYVPQEPIVEVTASSKDTTVKGNQTTNQNSEAPWVDPLFYIEGQLCQHARRIYQDKNGNLWIGSNVYGLMRYNGDTLEYFTEKDGLGVGRITGIVEDKKGNVWFGTYGGLSKYDPSASLKPDGKSFTNFSVKDGLVDNEIWSLIIDSQGMFWIGTMEGVSRFDGEVFTTFLIPKAHVKDTTTHLSYNRITSIMEDKSGAFWFGTDGFGITRYDPSASLSPDGKTFTFITKEDGLCDNNVTHILEDKKGNVWVGTMFGGISLYDPSASGGRSFTNFTKNGVVSGIEVWSIYEDKTENIWFPAENAGVYRYDGKSFTNYDIKNGLNTNGIQCIYEDTEGRYWLGGWGGLFRYEPSADEAGGESFFSVTSKGPWGK